MEDRRDMKVLQQGEKFKRLTNHPMHLQINSYGGGRLKRSNFIANSKAIAHKDTTLALAQPRHIQPASTSPPWVCSLPELSEEISGIGKKGT
uniref:Uncharacterized protein n=1 Tax=Arion vulgaris TaxID=1028688 RepID=A0A0B7BHN7_9EUPU